MAVTVYNRKSDSSSSGTLINHQNTSGGAERVIINYLRLKDTTAQNGYIKFQFGPSSDLIDIQISWTTAFGKNVAYASQFYNSASYNDHHWQSNQGQGAGDINNAPTEIMLADQEYFKIYWQNKANLIEACNIVVIPEGG